MTEQDGDETAEQNEKRFWSAGSNRGDLLGLDQRHRDAQRRVEVVVERRVEDESWRKAILAARIFSL